MKSRQLLRRQAKYVVSPLELRNNLPEGLRRLFDKVGEPHEGSGKYSIPNERIRISIRKEG